MNFRKEVKDISNKVSAVKPNIKNEEATKTSLILPLLKTLGYDIENPNEVIPEYNVNGDRVDYSIMKNDAPLLFIEAKNIDEDLSKHKDQIETYYNNSDVKIICLTNGLDYEFYSDLDKKNVMDQEPFLTLNIENLSEFEIDHLNNFTKENLYANEDNEIEYKIKAINFIRQQLENPSEEFVQFVANSLTKKRKTKKFLSRIRNIIMYSIRNILNDLSNGSIIFKPTIIEHNENSQVITTEEEMDGYKIIISILSEMFSIDNLSYKDTTSYFAVLANKNPKQWIARLCLGIKKKSIVIPNENGGSTRYYIKDVTDIYQYRDELNKSADRFLNRNTDDSVKIEQNQEEKTEQIEQEVEQIDIYNETPKKKKILNWLTSNNK